MIPPPLALVLDALPGPVDAALARAAELGYTHVELKGEGDRPAEQLDALADSGLLVAAVELVLPEMAGLAGLRASLVEMERQIADAARLGAGRVLLDLASVQAPLDQIDEWRAHLAEMAGRRMMPLCIAQPGKPHPNIMPWIKLSLIDGQQTAPIVAPLGGAIRIHVQAGAGRQVAQIVQSLGLAGTILTVSVWPEPVVGPRQFVAIAGT
jgi:hypothetical protein